MFVTPMNEQLFYANTGIAKPINLMNNSTSRKNEGPLEHIQSIAFVKFGVSLGSKTRSLVKHPIWTDVRSVGTMQASVIDCRK